MAQKDRKIRSINIFSQFSAESLFIALAQLPNLFFRLSNMFVLGVLLSAFARLTLHIRQFNV